MVIFNKNKITRSFVLISLTVSLWCKHELQIFILRSSHWRCTLKRGVLKNFSKFKGKHMSQSQTFRTTTLWKRDSSKSIYVWIFKIYKNTFLTEHLRGTTSVFSTQLLLDPQIGKRCFSGLKYYQLIEYFRGNSCHLRSLASLHKKWSFPFRISSVNVTKSAGNSPLWRNP